MSFRLPVTLAGLLGASLLVTHTVLAAAVTGIVWAGLAWPIHRHACRAVRPAVAATLTLLSTGLAVTAVLGVLAYFLLDDLRALAAAATHLEAGPPLVRAAHAKLAGLMAALARELERGTTTALLQVPIAVFVAFCCLKEGPRLAGAAARLLPLPRDRAQALVRAAGQKTRAVARGQILTAAIKGAVGGLGLWMAGVPGPVLLGTVMAVFTLLPILAAWMVWLPAAAWLASRGDTAAAAFLAVWGVLVVGLVDNIVRPVLVGRHARMHPAVALVGMAGGAMTLGLAGLVAGPVLLDATIALAFAWRAGLPEPSAANAGEAGVPDAPVPAPVPHPLSPPGQAAAFPVPDAPGVS